MPELIPSKFIIRRHSDADDFVHWINNNGLYQFKVLAMEKQGPTIMLIMMEYYGDGIEREDRIFEMAEAWANHKNWKTPRIPRLEPKENP